ncbi:TetR/AcrR family transcriptional regulator [Promicromonospora kroppenstedtii]|uniref:TetR/AcrR family transcriptional regulator n=1 Tax=Promicromonospora kroppenstedtii TaxID=440482 RepID=UPI0004BBD125|nr:TetR/AcrR family transcriptional regulator [Promicromonospora kroppenstedtii]
MSAPRPPEITLVGQPHKERSDAARNRTRLLDVAARLVAEHGAQNVTMDQIATEAGVGKGTVFRRFGDRTGLMRALLDHAERVFQQAFLTGPAPLGPGASPADRLRAFGAAAIEHRLRYRDMYLAAEEPAAQRYANDPPRDLLGRHIATLLAAAGTTGDLEVLTESLLAYLDMPLLNHLDTRRGMSVERIAAGWVELAERVIGPAPRLPEVP